jgi:C-terminal processing protease CtpA/Prc
VKEVKLARNFEDFTTLYHRERSGDIIKLLPGNIGYADLDRLTIGMIDDMLERFKNTKAIIFDMRGYPNGVFWFLAPRLAEKQGVAAALLETPIVGSSVTANALESAFQMVQPPPPDAWIYKGKTVMLIDERAASQSEHTGLFLRAANGTVFIGSRTTGVDGEITSLSVPGGIGIGFSGQSARFPDGKQLQRLGLIPDVEIKPTIKGIQQGRDEILDGAIRYLQKTVNK